MSKRVVLTVSGVIAADIREQIASGKRPRADYLELARSFDADLLDYAAARTIAGRMGAVLEKLGGPNLVLAYACWKVRKSYQAIVTDGEQIGLPLATLLKFTPGTRPRHLMIVHVISEPKKTFFLDWLGVQSAIDRFITYSRWQQRFIEDRWKLGRNRVLWTPFMVDQEFFAPERVTPNPSARPQICAVGLERRDYETLLRAVEDLDVHVVIAAASPWSKRKEGIATRTIPSNVTVRKFTQYELRQLYADSLLHGHAAGEREVPGWRHRDPGMPGDGKGGHLFSRSRPNRRGGRRRERAVRAAGRSVDPAHGDPTVAVSPRGGSQIGRQRPQAGRTPDEPRSLCSEADRCSTRSDQ